MIILCDKADMLTGRGQYKGALECFNNALGIDPQKAEAWYGKGVIFGKLKNHEAAIICFKTALKINPDAFIDKTFDWEEQFGFLIDSDFLEKLYEKYGDKITLIEIVYLQDLEEKDTEYMKYYSKSLIKHISPGVGFILSSGHSINPAVKL